MGRGVSRITEVYGRDNFDIEEGSITVRIPYKRLDAEKPDNGGNDGVDITANGSNDGGDITANGGNGGGNITANDGNDGCDIDEEKTQKISKREKILKIIENNRSISIHEIAEKIPASQRTVEREIRKLREEGKLIRHGYPNSGYWELIKENE